MFVGQTFYKSDLENNEIRDIYNQTESNFNWTDYSIMIEQSFDEEINNNYGTKEYEMNVKRIKNILIKFMDFIGYSTFEGTKWSIEYGYNHPKQDLGFFLEFLVKILWIILFITLIPLVIPLLAIIYLFCKGTIWLIKKIVGKKYD
jgi:hypothetical protein